MSLAGLVLGDPATGTLPSPPLSGGAAALAAYGAVASFNASAAGPVRAGSAGAEAALLPLGAKEVAVAQYMPFYHKRRCGDGARTTRTQTRGTQTHTHRHVQTHVPP